MLDTYLQALIGRIFKILPIYEENPDNSRSYTKLLHCELIGVTNVFYELKDKMDFIDAMSIVSFLANDDSYDLPTLRQLVFTAIDCVKKLQTQISIEGEGL